jgi:hypothetical protein
MEVIAVLLLVILMVFCFVAGFLVGKGLGPGDAAVIVNERDSTDRAIDIVAADIAKGGKIGQAIRRHS